jgi:heme-degrading monooxygenase HmoA
MTRSLLYLHAKPGRRDDLVRLFERREILRVSSEQPGFLRAELQVPIDDDDHVLVTADWSSPAAYQGWLDNPVRESMREEMMALLTREPEGRVYQVVASVS